MYKLWDQSGVEAVESVMRERLPDCNIFYESSMAAVAGVAGSTLRSYLRTDSSLNFIRRLESGERATHSDSMRAWTMRRSDKRKNCESWKSNFIRWEDVSSGSAAAIGRIDHERQRKKY